VVPGVTAARGSVVRRGRPRVDQVRPAAMVAPVVPVARVDSVGPEAPVQVAPVQVAMAAAVVWGVRRVLPVMVVRVRPVTLRRAPVVPAVMAEVVSRVSVWWAGLRVVRVA